MNSKEIIKNNKELGVKIIKDGDLYKISNSNMTSYYSVKDSDSANTVYELLCILTKENNEHRYSRALQERVNIEAKLIERDEMDKADEIIKNNRYLNIVLRIILNLDDSETINIGSVGGIKEIFREDYRHSFNKKYRQIVIDEVTNKLVKSRISKTIIKKKKR